MTGACDACNGRCCYDVAVGITGFDAWRIATAHGLPLHSFVTVATAEPSSLGAFRFHDGFAVLVLQRNPREERACAFLMLLPDGARRCGTYVSRPTVCRTYPMRRLVGGNVELRIDVACPPGAWDAGAIAAPGWSADLHAYESEWRGYERAIAAWNASPLDGLESFFRYVLAAYAMMHERAGSRENDGDVTDADHLDAIFANAIALALPEKHPDPASR
jgi:Fe-S-cluster containining protein